MRSSARASTTPRMMSSVRYRSNGAILMANHVVDLGETPPEGGRERDAADRGLQVEADQRHLLRHPAAMVQDRVLVLPAERGEAQKHRVIAQRAGDCRFLHRLRGPSDGACNSDQGPARPRIHGVRREREDGFEQPRVADGELGGVDTDRDTTRAGVDVIPRERPLAPPIEIPTPRQRERVRGDDRAAVQDVENLSRQFGTVQTHRQRISKTISPDTESSGTANCKQSARREPDHFTLAGQEIGRRSPTPPTCAGPPLWSWPVVRRRQTVTVLLSAAARWTPRSGEPLQTPESSHR